MKKFIVQHKTALLYTLGAIVVLSVSYIAYNQYRIIKSYENIVSLQQANVLITQPNMPIFDDAAPESDNIAAQEDYSYLGSDDTLPEN